MSGTVWDGAGSDYTRVAEVDGLHVVTCNRCTEYNKARKTRLGAVAAESLHIAWHGTPAV